MSWRSVPDQEVEAQMIVVHVYVTRVLALLAQTQPLLALLAQLIPGASLATG